MELGERNNLSPLLTCRSYGAEKDISFEVITDWVITPHQFSESNRDKCRVVSF